MPISFIKKWLFDAEMQKTFPKVEGNGKDIGVMTLFNGHTQDNEMISQFITSHLDTGASIHFLSYAHQKEPIISDSIYTLKDIAWAGYPKSDTITKFISHKFKRFYYLCPIFDDHQKFIVSKIHADFKAGVYSPGIEQFLDLTVDNPYSSAIESIKEIYQTISKLRNQRI